MDKYRIMESKIVEDIKNLCKTPDEFKAHHDRMMDFIITKPSAYKAIQEEISRRANAGL